MYRGNDILKIYDKDFNNIGRATREEVHTKGLLHQVAHVWLLQPDGEYTNIFFQKRSLSRELFPGKYDLMQTTHFDPEESYEEGIIHSMDYYLGSRIRKEDIVHIGSIRQIIDEGNYHDNALVQVFVITVSKIMFYMPDTEAIVKAHYRDFEKFIHGKTDALTIYSPDDIKLGDTTADEWWLRKEEFFDVVEPYILSKRQ